MNEAIRALLVSGHRADPTLKREVADAMWADIGRAVHPRITDDELISVLTRASLKAKNTRELAAMIRIYLLTGVRP